MSKHFRPRSDRKSPGVPGNLTFLIHQFVGKPMAKKPSVIFVSVHKCATSLFQRLVIPNVKGLTPIPYEKLIYQNHLVRKIVCRDFGYIYGVCRIHEDGHPLHKITSKVLMEQNRTKKDIIILIRDPRDILVSMYYSFGFTHTLSPNKKIRRCQIERRERIRQLGLDKYVQEVGPRLKAQFDFLSCVLGNTESVKLLKYEDMLHNYDSFYDQLAEVLALNSDIKEMLYVQSRPRTTEEPAQHKRSGSPGSYKTKLCRDSISQINNIFKDTLPLFGYSL